MPDDGILIHVDYAENDDSKLQGECQSAYFRHTRFSIFRAAGYIRYLFFYCFFIYLIIFPINTSHQINKLLHVSNIFVVLRCAIRTSATFKTKVFATLANG